MQTDRSAAVFIFWQQSQIVRFIIDIGITRTDRNILVVADVVLEHGANGIIELFFEATRAFRVSMKCGFQMRGHTDANTVPIKIPERDQLNHLALEYRFAGARIIDINVAGQAVT